MRRSSDTSVFDLAPGDYMLTKDKTGVWLRTPTGALIRVPVVEGEQDPRPIDEGGAWGFTEGTDGSLSLTPSLDVHGEDPWHGFLTNGKMMPA